MARLARESADRPHGDEPAVEAVLRHRPEQGARRSRRAGRAAAESGAARLARLRVHGQRLGHETHGPHDRHQRRPTGRSPPRRPSCSPPIPTTASSPGRAASGSMPNWCATTRSPSPACSSPKIGGPSVKPYQPEGYWENLNFPTRDTWPTRARASIAAASTPGGSAASCIRSCSRSTRPAARNAPPSATARTSRSRRSCC